MIHDGYSSIVMNYFGIIDFFGTVVLINFDFPFKVSLGLEKVGSKKKVGFEISLLGHCPQLDRRVTLYPFSYRQNFF